MDTYLLIKYHIEPWKSEKFLLHSCKRSLDFDASKSTPATTLGMTNRFMVEDVHLIHVDWVLLLWHFDYGYWRCQWRRRIEYRYRKSVLIMTCFICHSGAQILRNSLETWPISHVAGWVCGANFLKFFFGWTSQRSNESLRFAHPAGMETRPTGLFIMTMCRNIAD